jgi:hypothetical protein
MRYWVETRIDSFIRRVDKEIIKLPINGRNGEPTG